jgi:acetyl esterase/lipase
MADMLAFEEYGRPRDSPEATTAGLIVVPGAESVTIQPVQIPWPHGPIDACAYRTPGTDTVPGLVWMHGGAFVAGTRSSLRTGFAIAAGGIPVLSAEYRKALHGVKHPVLSDDVLTAFLAAPQLLGNPTHLHIGGASAGANLAAGVAKRLRDGAGPLPAGMVLAYGLFHSALPAYSDELTATLATAPEVDAVWRVAVPAINLHLVGDAELLDDPYAFPANGDVAGLPPTYLINSEVDSLRASGEAFARQLADAGIDVVVETEPGTQHGHLDQPLQPHGALDRRWSSGFRSGMNSRRPWNR